MFRPIRLGFISFTCLAGFMTLWLFFSMAGAQLASSSAQPATAQTEQPATPSLDPTSPYHPCGTGEQLPPWAICLYGMVGQEEANGDITPLNGVAVTVTLGNQSVTGTTFVHPGQITPIYSLDISLLNPTFLQPVTLTTVINNVTLTRQVVVFPNFDTLSQRYDVVLPVVNPLNQNVWGYVVDFASGGPVAGAIVTAKHDGTTITVTTAVHNPEEEPFYVLDPAIISATADDLIILTTTYNGDTDQKRLILPDTLPVQVNFVTGWQCDNFDPLPGTTGPGGLPGTTGPGGLPDVACFWGYVLADGRPVAGADVHLTISGTHYTAQTGPATGESLPRYGIGVWGGQTISGTVVTATVVYSGNMTYQPITVTLDTNLSQRVDFSLSQPSALANFMNGNSIYDLVWHENRLWAATTGGIVRWNPEDGSYYQFTSLDGLPNNEIRALAVDQDGIFWFATWGSGVGRYDPHTNIWTTYTTDDGLLSNLVQAVAPAPDGTIWFGTFAGASHYTPATTITPPLWENYTDTNGVPFSNVSSIAVHPDETVWFATRGGGVRHFTPTLQSWEVFTTVHGLAHNVVNDVAVDTNGDLWFATGGGGVSQLANSGWHTYTTLNGLSNQNVNTVTASPDNSLWFGTPNWFNRGSVSHYVTGTVPTWTRFTPTNGLPDGEVMAIAIAPDRSPWVAPWSYGLSHYLSATTTWENFVMTDTVVANDILAVDIQNDGSLWLGTGGGVGHHIPSGNPEWTAFTTQNGLLVNRVPSLVTDEDRVWMATDGGGVSCYTITNSQWTTFTSANSDLAYDRLQTIAIGPNHSVWMGFGSFGHGVSRYDGQWSTFTVADGLLDDKVMAIAAAPDDSLWFGTWTGVSHYISSTNSWENFTHTTGGLPLGVVQAVAVSPDGSLWFGTLGNGVHHYLPDSNSWVTYTAGTGGNSGLIYNIIQAIAIGHDGSLWFGTPVGLSHYTPGGNPEWESFTFADGLPHQSIQAIGVAPEGSLWLGTANGVSHWLAVAQQSDLSLALNVPEIAVPGQLITYSLTLANNGQRDATHAKLTLTYPYNNSHMVWDLGTLPADGTPVTRVITAPLPITVTPGTLLTATATATTSSPEAFLTNNTAQVATYVVDPYRSDVRVTVGGPPLLVPGNQAEYTVIFDNIGGLDAANTQLTVTVPTGLSIVSSSIPPSNTSPTQWQWDFGTVPSLVTPMAFTFTVDVDSGLPAGLNLTANAVISTSTPDSDPGNNLASATVSTSLTDAQTLFLVAPDRLTSRYGASPLLNHLYQLAQHPLVAGAILDVMSEAAVAAAYTAWDADPGNWHRANDVATAIKTLIDQYTLAYPNLQYLVIVGGDEIIPFYRLADQNSTVWQEDDYASYLRPSTVQSALASNRLLTDDFYADRTPTTVNSPFWFDGHPLYIPDFALGRLVETPEEIQATINAFFSNNGVITLGPGLVGTLPELTDDLGDQQCTLLQNAGLGHLCTHSSQVWESAFLNDLFGSLWLTVHGNHFSVGPLYAHELADANANYDNAFLANLSCHGGLNDPQPIANNWPDLPQAFLGQGGSYLGSTAYTYASWFGVQYSEAIAAAFLENLLVANPPTLGQALVQTKQEYYATYGYLFTYLDEKVLVPTTFYGLPMLQVDATPLNLVPPSVNPSLPPAYQPNGGIITVPFTRNNLTFDLHTLPDGQYYSYQGQVLATHYRPVQPVDDQALPADINGAVAHGFVLTQATFSEEADFDIRIGESWILGSGGSLPIEPTVTLSGWDHPFPVYLTQFTGLLTTQTNLNFVLGVYDADRGVERLYEELMGEVLYSDSSDWTPPTLISQAAYTTPNRTVIEVQAHDDGGMAQVVALCTEGQGSWTGVNLTRQGQTWQGSCPVQTTQFMVQLVDAAANVTRTPWQTPSGPAIFTSYLPIMRNP